MPVGQTYKQTWEIAKKKFETNTGKKKPPATIIGFIKKHKSGVGSKLGKADEARENYGASALDDKPAAMKAYKKALNFKGRDLPYFFVLNPAGEIVYATSGKYSERKMQEIIEAVDEALEMN